MRTGTVSYKLEDLKKGVIIPIGFVGENDFTRVIFDAEEIYKKYPSASVSMKVQPPKGVIYPAAVTRDGNTVIWQVKESDVANRGGGELQLTFIDGETKIKTYIAKTDVKRSLAGNGPAPDPVQDWVDNAEEVLDDLGAMDNIAKNAQTSDIGKFLSPKTVVDGVVTEWQYVEQSGGTEDYTDLENKPSIAGVTLSGNKTLEDLGIAAADDLDNLADDVTDVKNAIQGKYTKPSDGIPATDLTQAVQNSLGAANSAYQKPSGGIPATDIADGVIPVVDSALSDSSENAVQNKVVKGALDGKAPVIINTATGNPAVFNDGGGMPIKSLLIPFTPIQSGTGDPSPQNIRSIMPWDGLTVGQINGIVPDISNNSGMEKVNGQWQNSIADTKTRFDAYIQLFKDSTYIKEAGSKAIATSGIYSITFNVDDANCNRIVFLHSGSRDNLSVKFPFELPQGTYTISFNVVSANPSVIGGLAIKDIFLVAGGDVQRTESKVFLSKNVFNPTIFTNRTASGLTSEVKANGKISFSGTPTGTNRYAQGSGRYFTLPAGTYCISGNPYNLRFVDEDGNQINTYKKTMVTLERETSFSVGIRGLTTEEAVSFDEEIMVAKSDSPVEWEPYSPVYGGTLDVVSGVLMTGWKVETLDDSDAWTDGGTFISYSNYAFTDRKVGDSFIGVCSALPIKNNVPSGTAYMRWGETGAPNILIAPNGSGLTLEDVKTLSGQGKIVLAYPLATPAEQTLTGHQITALVGNNTIWSDANGQMTVAYPADTKTYISNLIATAIASL